MKIFVVIVTFNGERWIKKCIQNIYNSSVSCSIVIVDNASTDSTQKIIEEFTEIELIRQSTNLGFGKANNIGISYSLQSGADYIFLVNQDVYININVIENLVNLSRKNLDYGIVSPIHLNGSGGSLDIRFNNYIIKNKTLISDLILRQGLKEIYEVPFVNAAAWFLPSSIFSKIGGFDPIFYHYGEDVNFCQRLKYHDFKIGIAPHIFINHDRLQNEEFVFRSDNEYLNNLENKYKVYLANINRRKISNIRYKKIILTKILKAVLKLDFRNCNKYFKELNMYSMLTPHILKSRITNIKIGSHYL